MAVDEKEALAIERDIRASTMERIAKLEAALKYVRSLARDEQLNPTEMHMTCLSIIERTADEALRN